MKKDLKYTTIHHDTRKELWISMIEYCILDSIMRTQKNWYSYMSKEYIAEWLWVPERTLYEYIKKLLEKNLIEKSANWRLLKVDSDVCDKLLFWVAEVADFWDESLQKLQSKSAEVAYYNNIYNINNKSKDLYKEKSKSNISEKTSVLSFIKEEVTNRWKVFTRNNKMDIILIGHLLNNQDVKKILETKNIDIKTFINKIFTLSENIEWYRNNPIDSVTAFYYNWWKILNKSKEQIKKNITDEQKDLAFKDF